MPFQNDALYDELFEYLFYITGAVSICSNSLLLYMIFTKGTNRIKEYHILLGNTAFIDLLKSVMLTVVQPRVLVYKSTYAYVALGPVHYLGPHVAYIIFETALVMSSLSIISILLSFSYRYYVVRHGALQKRKLWLICLMVDSCGIIQLICALLSECDPKYIKEVTARNTGLNLTDKVVFGSDIRLKPLVLVVAALVSIPIFPIYVAIIYLKRRINKEMEAAQFQMSKMTKAMHLRLMKVLTLQALVPPIFIIPPITIFILEQLEIINAPIVGYIIFFIANTTPSVNAVLTLYCVKPYRDAILSLLGVHLEITESQMYSSMNAENKPTMVFQIPQITRTFKVITAMSPKSMVFP